MTVTEVLDRLAAGTITLEQAEADFRRRTWPKPPSQTYGQAAIGDLGPAAGPDSWDAVNADSRLTAEAYQRLAAARRDAMAK